MAREIKAQIAIGRKTVLKELICQCNKHQSKVLKKAVEEKM
jgi:hypothetical protein